MSREGGRTGTKTVTSCHLRAFCMPGTHLYVDSLVDWIPKHYKIGALFAY